MKRYDLVYFKGNNPKNKKFIIESGNDWFELESRALSLELFDRPEYEGVTAFYIWDNQHNDYRRKLVNCDEGCTYDPVPEAMLFSGKN